MTSTVHLSSLIPLIALVFSGCAKATTASSITAVPADSSAVPNASAPSTLVLEWKAARKKVADPDHPGRQTNDPSDPELNITLLANQTRISLGRMDASGDDIDVTYSIPESTATSSKFGCGGTPAFHYFTATLTGGSLVIALTEGVDLGANVPAKSKTKEIKRIPSSATSLRVKPFRMPDACGKGFEIVQDGTDAFCGKSCPCGVNELCETVRADTVLDDGSSARPVSAQYCIDLAPQDHPLQAAPKAKQGTAECVQLLSALLACSNDPAFRTAYADPKNGGSKTALQSADDEVHAIQFSGVNATCRDYGAPGIEVMSSIPNHALDYAKNSVAMSKVIRAAAAGCGPLGAELVTQGGVPEIHGE